MRAGMPLRLIAQNPETEPIPVAAAHAAEGLHVLLGVIGTSYQAVAAGDVDTLAAQAGVLRTARNSLQTAIDNTNLLPAGHAQIGRPAEVPHPDPAWDPSPWGIVGPRLVLAPDVSD